MSTRNSRKASFTRLFKEVMDTEEDDTIYNVFSANSITMIHEILTMSKDDINGLMFPSKDGLLVSPPPHVLAKLHILKAWNTYLLQEYELKIIDWDNQDMINEEAYNQFRASIYNPDSTPTALPLRKPPPVAAKAPAKSHSAAAEFRKGIKRDKSHYTVLSDEKQWDEWKSLTISTIYAHGCENIISNSYSPQDPDEIVLFKEQNKFMFDVFTHILKTPMGRYIVRNHEHARNAQKVWADYVKFMRTSTKADIEIEDLMTALTSIRLSSSYDGTTQNFMIDWLDKMRKYEELTPRDSHFPETMKKAMLQNAVSDFSIFRNVKLTEQFEVAKGNGPIPYLQYIGLLQSVASSYDRNVSPTTARPKRLTNIHDFYREDLVPIQDDVFDEDDFNYYGSYQINAAGSQTPHQKFRPTLNKDTWSKLSRSDQLVWDQMSNFGKWAIINGLRRSAGTKSDVTPRTPISNKDNNQRTPESGTLAHQTVIDPVVTPSDDTAQNMLMSVAPEDDSTILVNTLSSHKVPTPSQPTVNDYDLIRSNDIRKVLSTTDRPQNPALSPPASAVMQRYKTNVHKYVISRRIHGEL